MAFIDVPPPLTECPGFSTWLQFRGQEFSVFIDESFYQFFDFARSDGNFCHGAFGLPNSEYHRFQQSVRDSVHDYRSQLRGKDIEATELKHADLYKLPLDFRRTFATRLDRAIKDHGGFIGGFYASNRGFVLEKIREDLLLTDATKVPEDHSVLYQQKVAELNAALDSAQGRADLIGRLLNTAIAGVSNFLGAFHIPFRLIYDRGRSTFGPRCGRVRTLGAAMFPPL